MIKFLFLFFFFLVMFPVLLMFLFFIFPPTRKLFGYFIKKKFQKMSQNGQVYYRSYHFKSDGFSRPEFRNYGASIRDVTPTDSELIDVAPISKSNLRKESTEESPRL